ncbi:vesicle transport protein SFT2B-like [Trifolium pratense]|uniref:Vesicle transport protein SFT2B-like n=1 Tax=Trifolium pratense TaxID=57577 RepID=A0A2K3K0X7_TRIPR|nr:vesicle transport protein SFT2B-like [Trifolium pratense]
MWKKLGESLSGDNEEQEESWLDEDSGGLCSLSTTQRIYGFAACSIAGLALMLLTVNTSYQTSSEVSSLRGNCPSTWKA